MKSKEHYDPYRQLSKCKEVKNKSAEIGNLIDSSNPNIAIGTETWLRKNICSSEIFPDESNVYRGMVMEMCWLL